jgi:ribosome-associated translation inhibitor RaiA
MQIQVRTDHNIDGHEKLSAWVQGVIEQALAAGKDRITRVDVHLSDENAGKNNGTADMRCVIEAHVAGRPPVVVTENADTIHVAVTAATNKLDRLIDHTLERVKERNGDGTPHRW